MKSALFQLVLLGALCACTHPGNAAAVGPALTALDGSSCRPMQRAPGSVNVIVFISQECPIANAYAPTFRELATAWRDQPVHLFLVHVDPELSLAAAKAHATEFDLPATIVLDPHQELAKALDATRTPEAFVLADAGTVYRGRIDDLWGGLGARSQEASCHDLRDAVAAVLAGKAVQNPVTDAIGCLLPEPKR